MWARVKSVFSGQGASEETARSIPECTAHPGSYEVVRLVITNTDGTPAV